MRPPRSAHRHRSPRTPSLSTLGYDNKYTLSLGRSFRVLGQEAGVLASIQFEDFDGPRIVFPKQELPRDAQGEPSVDLGPHAEPGFWGGPVNDQWYRRTVGGYVRLDLGELSLSTRATLTRMAVPLSDLYENRTGSYDDLRNQNNQQLVLSNLRYRLRINEKLEGMARAYFGYSSNVRSRYVISHDPLVDGVPLGVLDPEQCPIGPTGPCRKDARFFSRWVGLELQSRLDWWGDGVSTTMLGVDGRLRTAAYEFVAFDDESGQSYGSDPAQTRWHGGGHDIANEYSLGAYLQQVVKPWKYLALNAGLRLDFDSRIPTKYLDDALSPRLALIATPTDRLAFKLIYSKAFRAPSFLELNIVNGRLLPNPDGLKPETVASYEAIGSLRVGSHALNLGAFYAQWNDLIELQIVKAQAPSVSQYDNVQGIDNYGANVSYEASVLERRLRFGLNGTYAIARRNLSSEEEARNPDAGDSVPVTVAPKLFGNARVSYSYGQGAVALAAGYFGRRIADQAYYGGDASNLAPRPVAPAQLETRLTLTGQVPGLPGLEYLAGASYLIASHQPYVVGPNQGQPQYLVPQAVEADLALVNRLTVFVGLSYHLGADGSPQVGRN
jgi:outer membrane receptor for ferrienterochelin and colicins